mmetsp:Transcript_10615/g.22252  ORF Transcript_10615/g.22252 Transcript_10615/m.22252 type:complete len:93 (-) Transcript_10615:550-828(-)
MDSVDVLFGIDGIQAVAKSENAHGEGGKVPNGLKNEPGGGRGAKSIQMLSEKLYRGGRAAPPLIFETMHSGTGVASRTQTFGGGGVVVASSY